MTPKELTELLESKQWTFAKTMPKNPHYWSHQPYWNSREEFESAVVGIRQHGIKQYYGGYSYICFYANGWKYWDMGEPLKQCTLINRKNLEENPDK